MEMHRGLLFSMLLVVLVALIRTTSSLPPDFFRNGRADILPHKRNSVEGDLISSACSFCGLYSSNFDFECKQNIGTRRRDCVLAYVEQVEGILSKRGWK